VVVLEREAAQWVDGTTGVCRGDGEGERRRRSW